MLFYLNSKMLLDCKHHFHQVLVIQHKHLPHTLFLMDSKILSLFQHKLDTNLIKLRQFLKLLRMPLPHQDQLDQLKLLPQLKKKRKKKLKKQTWEIYSEEMMMDIDDSKYLIEINNILLRFPNHFRILKEAFQIYLFSSPFQLL